MPSRLSEYSMVLKFAHKIHVTEKNSRKKQPLENMAPQFWTFLNLCMFTLDFNICIAPWYMLKQFLNETTNQIHFCIQTFEIYKQIGNIILSINTKSYVN